jgi:predicted transcriptional regulator
MGKPAPTFWWDFNNKSVIVQSDYPGGECLARFVIPEDQDAQAQITAAEGVISDYEAGRKTPQWHVRH